MGYNNRQYQAKFLGSVTTVAASTNAGTLVISGAGTLHGVVVGTTAGSAVVVYDSAVSTTSGTLVVLKASIAEDSYVNLDASYASGLYMTFPNGGTYTVLYTSN